MLAPTNFWMIVAGLVYLLAGLVVLRKELGAARGWNKFIALGTVFVAASLAAFAPEHFRGPEFVQSMVPSWMPLHKFWPPFVGCALLAAGASLAARRCLRLSSTMLAIMFSLFVCMIYLPSALTHLGDRSAWDILLRDSSFAAGSWALAGVCTRASSPRTSRWMILFGRIVLATAAIFFGIQHFLHPECSPGVPSEMLTPAWVAAPRVWAYLTGAVLLPAGIALLLNKQPRIAATVIGAVMTVLTVCIYLVMLLRAHGPNEVNLGINFVADTLLYAGMALVVASALPRDAELVKQ